MSFKARRRIFPESCNESKSHSTFSLTSGSLILLTKWLDSSCQCYITFFVGNSECQNFPKISKPLKHRLFISFKHLSKYFMSRYKAVKIFVATSDCEILAKKFITLGTVAIHLTSVFRQTICLYLQLPMYEQV